MYKNKHNKVNSIKKNNLNCIIYSYTLLEDINDLARLKNNF